MGLLVRGWVGDVRASLLISVYILACGSSRCVVRALSDVGGRGCRGVRLVVDSSYSFSGAIVLYAR